MFFKGQTDSLEWCVYKVEVSLDQLILQVEEASSILAWPENIKTTKRKKEYLATRIALKELFKDWLDITYDAFGKPLIKKSEWNISISHSGDYIAVARSKKHLGIDIEMIRETLDRTKHKFCSAAELIPIDPKQYLLHLCLLWSAKESAYKAVGNYPFIFDKELLVDTFIPNKQGHFPLKINSKSHQETVNIQYQIIENYVFTFCTLA
jgi:4'-phosphopantetheinyl transferase EntD